MQHSQVIPDVRHRADGRAGIVADRFLVDRDDWREAVDKVDVGLLELCDKPLGEC